ncbi:hypothetical protein [Heyndrickxia coagulans]|uniref:hypothetical protein n=1 Tax=Heyndrickxia coagulans TaxID=1398 RepID=UPI000779460C|nr:hypothetical protein [Heyndrickxia coagulans]KYC67159.1 hypothetical protein B4100_3795 [Heyndrickxia coagulans]
MKIDWKAKLASRKFWALLGGLVGSLLVAFNVSKGSVAQVTSIITAFGSVAVYILAESSVDKAAVTNVENKAKEDEKTE